MLTAIGRASVQRLVTSGLASTTKVTPLAAARTLSARGSWTVVARSFSTSYLALEPAAKATKKATTSKKGPAKKKTTAKSQAKKPAVKKKPKKVLTPEEKAKADIRALKAAALLQSPKKTPENAWSVYLAEGTKGSTTNVSSKIKELASSFKSLSSAELQRLQNTADSNKLSNNAEYKAWVEGYTPAQIEEANLARARLSRKYGLKRRAIKDDRQPKRAAGAFSFFTKARWGSGDLSGQTTTEAAKQIAAEWKSLSASEKQTYEDLCRADRARYNREAEAILGKSSS